jgi:hypothetical protein
MSPATNTKSTGRQRAVAGALVVDSAFERLESLGREAGFSPAPTGATGREGFDRAMTINDAVDRVTRVYPLFRESLDAKLPVTGADPTSVYLLQVACLAVLSGVRCQTDSDATVAFTELLTGTFVWYTTEWAPIPGDVDSKTGSLVSDNKRFNDSFDDIVGRLLTSQKIPAGAIEYAGGSHPWSRDVSNITIAQAHRSDVIEELFNIRQKYTKGLIDGALKTMEENSAASAAMAAELARWDTDVARDFARIPRDGGREFTLFDDVLYSYTCRKRRRTLSMTCRGSDQSGGLHFTTKPTYAQMAHVLHERNIPLELEHSREAKGGNGSGSFMYFSKGSQMCPIHKRVHSSHGNSQFLTWDVITHRVLLRCFKTDASESGAGKRRRYIQLYPLYPTTPHSPRARE